jgi:hypothetical protein
MLQLLVVHKPHLPSLTSASPDPATFEVRGSAFSIKQQAFVAHSHEALVWYDYDKLRKCKDRDLLNVYNEVMRRTADEGIPDQ